MYRLLRARESDPGVPERFAADVVAVAKRDLRAGEVLDGEGGSTVWGRLMPAADSLAADALPIGLAAGASLKRQVAAGEAVARADVELQVPADVLELRGEMERDQNSILALRELEQSRVLS